MPRMQTMTRMFGLELELADCTTWWRWQGTLISSSLKTNYLKLSSKDEKREKISKNCVLVFGKVKQNSDGEVRILLGKWSNLLGRWSNLLGRWSNLLGKWSKFDGEMKQNDGQMKQNLMGRCPIDKVHTTLNNSAAAEHWRERCTQPNGHQDHFIPKKKKFQMFKIEIESKIEIELKI